MDRVFETVGKDVEFEITLTDSNGDPVPLNTLEGYAVIFFTKNLKVVHKASSNDIGWGSFESTDDPSGIFSGFIPRENSKEFAGEDVYFYVPTQEESASLTGGREMNPTDLSYLFTYRPVPYKDLPDLNPAP